jgi:hypothetical protein
VWNKGVVFVAGCYLGYPVNQWLVVKITPIDKKITC